MVGKGNNRLNGRRIQELPLKNDASKTEAEDPAWMRNQGFSEKKIKKLQKMLDDWKKKEAAKNKQ